MNFRISPAIGCGSSVAEFVGGAVRLALLFQLPILVGMAVTSCITYGVLMLVHSGFRPIEMFVVPVNWGGAAFHALVRAPSRCFLRSPNRRYADIYLDSAPT